MSRYSQVRSSAAFQKSSGKFLFRQVSHVSYVISIAYVVHISCYLIYISETSLGT